MALVIMVFLMLMFGMLEMAIAVFRYHVVSQGARQAARLAIVHGELAPKGSNGTMTEWGPATFTSGANSGTEITEALKPYLAGVPLDKTTVTLEWLDGDTKLQSRVRATVVTAYQPFITFLFSSDWTLTGSSTMQIAH
jgi:Flp pilus assembly protein TadG